jgi:F-type H+-transporting ATPase subunit gamma
MKDERQLQDEINDLKTLKEMVKTYGETAAARMNRVRESVLYSRVFLRELHGVFNEVRTSYVDQVLEQYRHGRKNRPDAVTLLSHNGKSVAVLLSANTRLYGGLIQRTYEAFVQDVLNQKSEATIIGTVGSSMFANQHPDHPFTTFEMPDGGIDKDKFKKIAKHLVEYEEIRIYYGQFKNVISQEPTMYRLNAEIKLEPDASVTPVHFLFEPTLEEVLKFFESEIFNTLFEQTIKESQLAKYASRLVSMDAAEQKIGQRLKNVHLAKMRLNHQTANRKQLNSLSAVMAHF